MYWNYSLISINKRIFLLLRHLKINQFSTSEEYNSSPGLYSKKFFAPRNVKSKRMRHFRDIIILLLNVQKKILFFDFFKLKNINQSIIPSITVPINQIPPRRQDNMKQNQREVVLWHINFQGKLVDTYPCAQNSLTQHVQHINNLYFMLMFYYLNS